ncbi:hypothetical protein [Streptomyces catenulae]|uniref:Uncharacterized protein n=1 Tax=Streptomyces catenulae TaxID=66875 RepID=A0ABV2Z702_9ACTN|nr:hypothetical protein [Streptomyces catenulae]
MRAALVLSALAQGVPGGWALFLPHSFFRNFPLPGRRWVAVFAPYNEHLVRDFGSLVVALAAVLLCAARAPRPPLVRAAALAQLVFSVPHLLFHLHHLAMFSPADVVAQLITLVLPVVVALYLLWAAARGGGGPGTAVRAPATYP